MAAKIVWMDLHHLADSTSHRVIKAAPSGWYWLRHCTIDQQ